MLSERDYMRRHPLVEAPMRQSLFALAEKITGRLNLSEWHWIFWLLLQVFCLAESLVYARLLQLSFQAQLSNLLMRKQNKF